MRFTLDEQIKYAKATADKLDSNPKAQLIITADMMQMYRDMAENLIAIRLLRKFGDLAIDEVATDLDAEQTALMGKEESNG